MLKYSNFVGLVAHTHMTHIKHIYFWLLFTATLVACHNTKQRPTTKPSTKSNFALEITPKEVVTPRQYIITKTNTPLNIDGKANETAWKQAVFTKPFMDIEGTKTPKFKTQVKMLWSDQYLYVYAQLQEPHIWGNLKQRDTIIFYNNDFEVFIDPSGKAQNYGEIEVNALNTVWDLLLDKPYRVGGKAHNQWDLQGLKTAVYIQGTLNNATDVDSLWSVEMAIPMRPLLELKQKPQTLPKEGEQWRINFSRVQWNHQLVNGQYQRKKENGKFLPEYNWVWSNQKVINMHEPEKWGIVQFTEGNSANEVKFKQDSSFYLQQITYALFRMTRFGKAKNLLKKKAGTAYPMNIKYKNQQLTATFYKTYSGFEYVVNHPHLPKKWVINEEGNLKTIDQ